MTKYFIKLKDNQTGPFTIEELKEMNLTNQYLYWIEGYSTWKNIDQAKELEGFILKLPPIEDENLKKVQEITKKNKSIKIWIIVVGAFILFYLFGGFADKYDLLDNYPGLASSSNSSDAAFTLRVILLAVSTLIAYIFGLLFYYQQSMTVYKKIYEKKEL